MYEVSETLYSNKLMVAKVVDKTDYLTKSSYKGYIISKAKSSSSNRSKSNDDKVDLEKKR